MGLTIFGSGSGAAAGPIPDITTWKTGRYYAPPFPGLTTNTNAQSAAYFIPMWLGKQRSIDRVAVFANSTVASSVTRVGIFNDNGSGEPGTVALDAGQITTSGGAGSWTATVAKTLPAGLYWLAAVEQGVATGPQLLGPSGNSPYGQFVGWAGPGSSANTGFTATVAGAFTDNPTLTLSSKGITVWVRST